MRGPRTAKTKPFEAKELEEAALRYLNRFDCSVNKLKRYLSELVRRRGGDVHAFAEQLDALLERYQKNGMLDDARFAKNLGERLSGRGGSRRLVIAKLRARGIGSNDAEAAVPRSPDGELAAARALVRRRRLGVHRPEEERSANRRRDLATLARAGFTHDVASRALGSGNEDDF